MNLPPEALMWGAWVATVLLVGIATTAGIAVARSRAWPLLVTVGPTIVVAMVVSLPQVWVGAVDVAAQHRAQGHAAHVAELVGASWGAFPDADTRVRAERILAATDVAPDRTAAGTTTWVLPRTVTVPRWWAPDRPHTAATCVAVTLPDDPDDLTVQVRWCPPEPPDGAPTLGR